MDRIRVQQVRAQRAVGVEPRWIPGETADDLRRLAHRKPLLERRRHVDRFRRERARRPYVNVTRDGRSILYTRFDQWMSDIEMLPGVR
jgi:hypothetical protein